MFWVILVLHHIRWTHPYRKWVKFSIMIKILNNSTWPFQWESRYWLIVSIFKKLSKEGVRGEFVYLVESPFFSFYLCLSLNFHQRWSKIKPNKKWTTPFSFFIFPGLWLAAFNSVANPFVYALLMPTYRKCVIDTFCTCANKRESEHRKNESSSDTF